MPEEDDNIFPRLDQESAVYARKTMAATTATIKITKIKKPDAGIFPSSGDILPITAAQKIINAKEIAWGRESSNGQSNTKKKPDKLSSIRPYHGNAGVTVRQPGNERHSAIAVLNACGMHDDAEQ